jgi:uncharacterized sulfatase
MNYCFRFSILLFLMLGVSTNSFTHADSTKIESAINRPAKQPNVIFVLVDDLGWGDLGVFFQNESTHDRKHKTPHLDKMAAEGMQLRAHYCPAPVCAPSRASLLLGVHQGNAEIRNNQFDKALPPNHTIGSMMKAAGYRTAMIGKYGLQGKGDSAQSWPAYPTKRGFDEFFGYVRHVDGHLHYPAHNWPLGNSESHQTPKEVWWNENEVSANLQKCYTTDLFTAQSKKWIQQHQEQHADKPFFLCLTYDTPHAALQVPSVPYPAGLGINGGIQWTGEDGKMINTAVGEIDSFRHPDYTGKGWSDVEERFARLGRSTVPSVIRGKAEFECRHWLGGREKLRRERSTISLLNFMIGCQRSLTLHRHQHLQEPMASLFTHRLQAVTIRIQAKSTSNILMGRKPRLTKRF